MRFRVFVSLKHGVHDPQGEATLRVLQRQGQSAFKDVRIGKFLDVDIEAANAEDARKQVEQAAKDVFANTVIERFWLEELR